MTFTYLLKKTSGRSSVYFRYDTLNKVYAHMLELSETIDIYVPSFAGLCETVNLLGRAVYHAEDEDSSCVVEIFKEIVL